MKIKSVNNVVDDKTAEKEGQELQGEHTAGIDDFASNYLLSRQVAHEYNSPAMEALKRNGYQDPNLHQDLRNVNLKPLQNPPTDKSLIQGDKTDPTDFHADEIEKAKAKDPESQALEEPWVDPITAASGGFAGGLRLSLARGAKLMPSLGRALSSGLIGGVADYPIGQATDEVAEEHPILAMPFSLVVGMASGVTLERAVEESLVKLMGDVAPSVVKKIAAELSSGKIVTDLAKRVKGDAEEAFASTRKLLSSEKGSIDIGVTSKKGPGDIPTTETSISPKGGKLPKDSVVVYHGSHEYNTPISLMHYGEGEGGQGFGYGIHVTTTKDSADNYAVRSAEFEVDGKEYFGNAKEYQVIKSLFEKGYAAAKEYEIANIQKHPESDFAKERLKILESFKKSKIIDLSKPGKVYQFQLSKSDLNYFLDYHLPLNKQPKEVKNILKLNGFEDTTQTGEDLYYGIAKELGGEHDGDKGASEFLQGIGIKGIRYIDELAGSYHFDPSSTGYEKKIRNKELYNYTIFNPDQLNPYPNPTRSPDKVSKDTWSTLAKNLLKSEEGAVYLETPKGKPPATQTPLSKKWLENDPLKELSIREEPGSALAGNINLSRLDSPERIDEAILRTATTYKPQITEARRGVQSNKETVKLAGLVGMTPERLLKRKKGQAFNAETAFAARQVLVSSAENLMGLAHKVRMAEATDIDKFEFRKAVNLHYAIQAQVSGMTAEAGRALQSFNIVTDGSALAAKQVKEALGNLPDGQSLDKMAEMLGTFENAEQVGTFVKQAQRATTIDMLLEAWINGLLSGPKTHAVNTLSNSLVGLWMIPERALASGIRRVVGGEGVKGGETLQQAYGLIEGFKDGMKAFGHIMKTGEPLDQLEKVEVRRFRAITADNVRELPAIKKLAPNDFQEGGVAAWAINMLGEGIRTPGRALMAEDAIFKSIGYRMELRARAYRAIKEEGLKDVEGDLAASNRLREILADPQANAPEIHAAAIDASRYQTFTKPLGEDGRHFQAILNNHPALRLIVPFMRTPTNIVKFAGERTPLAFMSKNVRAELSAGGARRDLALAKIGLGSMVMATTAVLTGEGKITGGGPSDPTLKQVQKNSGWKPYSFKIGDKYYSYARLEPLGMMVGIAADAAEIMGQMENDEEREKLASTLVMAVSKNVTSKTWLRGISELINVMEDPDRYGERYIQRLIGSIVPTGVSQIEQVLDPEWREVRSALDQIKSRIPGYSDDLPAYRNIWGDIQKQDPGWGPDIISPIAVSAVKNSPIDKELVRLRMPVRKPRKVQSFQGVPIMLSPKKYDRLIVLMNEKRLDSTGKTLKKSLDALVKTGDYKRSHDEIKEDRISDLLNEAKSMARELLYLESTNIQKLVRNGHKQQEARRR